MFSMLGIMVSPLQTVHKMAVAGPLNHAERQAHGIRSRRGGGGRAYSVPGLVEVMGLQVRIRLRVGSMARRVGEGKRGGDQ